MRGYDRTKAAWRTAFSARRAVLGGRGRLAKQARFVAGKIKRQDAAYVDVLVKARGKRIGPRSRVRLRADNLFGPCGWGSAALATERVERKLAAILAADVAGYSRLMGSDEEGTLARLKA